MYFHVNVFLNISTVLILFRFEIHAVYLSPNYTRQDVKNA